MGWQIIKPTRFSIARKGKQCWSRFVRLSSPGAVCAVASGCTGNKWFHQAAIVWGRSVCTQHSQQLVYFSYLFIYLHLQPNIHSVERHQYRRNTIPECFSQTIVKVSQLLSRQKVTSKNHLKPNVGFLAGSRIKRGLVECQWLVQMHQSAQPQRGKLMQQRIGKESIKV